MPLAVVDAVPAAALQAACGAECCIHGLLAPEVQPGCRLRVDLGLPERVWDGQLDAGVGWSVMFGTAACQLTAS